MLEDRIDEYYVFDDDDEMIFGSGSFQNISTVKSLSTNLRKVCW